MAFWNPWNLKIIEVVSDFPFSGSNPDYDRICVVCSKARSSHALHRHYSFVMAMDLMIISDSSLISGYLKKDYIKDPHR